jgi:ABC-type phosphate transport system substrate-binding protein
MTTRTQRAKATGHTKRVVTLFVALACALASPVLIAGAVAWADTSSDYVLIAHPGNPATEITREFVANAFLKRVTRWDDGEMIRPIDLPPDARPRRSFSSEILNRSVQAVRSYWQQRIFSGRDLPPLELATDEEVVRYVLGAPGALGYVSRGTKLEQAKVLVVR